MKHALHALVHALGAVGVAASALGTVLVASAADEIAVERPMVDGRRIDRCVDGDGPTRCESAARERVADEACRAQGEGFIGAVDGSVRYEGSLLPRSVAVWSDRRRAFVEARGVDVIASVVCLREPSAPRGRAAG